MMTTWPPSCGIGMKRPLPFWAMSRHTRSVSRAVAGQHRVDDDVLLFRHRQRGRIFGVLRIVHVRRRVADQEHDPPGVAGERPAQLVDGDVERLVDAFGPVAAAARLQLQQVGVEVLDVGGEVEGPGRRSRRRCRDRRRGPCGCRRRGWNPRSRSRSTRSCAWRLRSGRPSSPWCPARRRPRRWVLPRRPTGRRKRQGGEREGESADGDAWHHMS